MINAYPTFFVYHVLDIIFEPSAGGALTLRLNVPAAANRTAKGSVCRISVFFAEI